MPPSRLAPHERGPTRTVDVPVMCSFIQFGKIIQKHFHPKTVSSKKENNFIHDNFIPKRFHPRTVSSKNGSMGTRRADSSLRRTSPGRRRDPWSSSESSGSHVPHLKSLCGQKSFWCGSTTLNDTVGATGEHLPASVYQSDHDFKSCRAAAVAKWHLHLPQQRQ